MFFLLMQVFFPGDAHLESLCAGSYARQGFVPFRFATLKNLWVTWWATSRANLAWERGDFFSLCYRFCNPNSYQDHSSHWPGRKQSHSHMELSHKVPRVALLSVWYHFLLLSLLSCSCWLLSSSPLFAMLVLLLVNPWLSLERRSGLASNGVPKANLSLLAQSWKSGWGFWSVRPPSTDIPLWVFPWPAVRCLPPLLLSAQQDSSPCVAEAGEELRCFSLKLWQQAQFL